MKCYNITKSGTVNFPGNNFIKGIIMLKIEHLTKVYAGGKVAVSDLSLSISPGEIFGFIGHNGAGKTTTIRCMVGVLPYDEGRIQIGSFDQRTDPLACKQITAYIPDNPAIYDYLTGIQYLKFICDVYKIPEGERSHRINRYAEDFEIKSELSKLISSYSHGMKQKLCIIGALIRDPKLLVLDEPFVGLDPKASHKLKLHMRELCSNGGAIFFSTHVLPVAETLCNRVGIIKDGKLVVCGTMDEVRGNTSLENVFLELIDE